MTHKRHKIAALIETFRDQELDAHYLGYFDCFNRQLFFEAHEVLENLWLAQRGQPKARFYQALIQLAGAFVHVQKQRPGPAVALFRLAERNLSDYPRLFEGLDLGMVRELIQRWTASLQSQPQPDPASQRLPWPKLGLERIKGRA